jgi:ankyrin repeat protein
MFIFYEKVLKKSLFIICLLLMSQYSQAEKNDVYSYDEQSQRSNEQNINSDQKKQWQELMQYFFAAARLGDAAVIDEFVNAGFPIDIKNMKGYTALMISSYNGRPETVNKLLTLGANACAEDKRGNTAVMAAIFRGEFSIAKRLIEADCNENHQNNAGQTPLMYASLFGREELKILLIDRGADKNKADKSGNTAASISNLKD